MQAEAIAEIILNRRYEEITQEVETISTEAVESLSLSERLLRVAERNSRLVMEIEDGFDSVEPKLLRVIMVAEEVLAQELQAWNNTAMATALLDEIDVSGDVIISDRLNKDQIY